MKHLVRRSPRVVGSLQLWDRVVLTERSPGARSRVPLQGQFTLLVEAGTAGSDESSQRSRRELKILKSFMLLPDPPLVSSEPFSWMRQKGRRLNVTPADRCGCKKVDSGGFFAGNLQKSTSLIEALIYPRSSLLGGPATRTRDLAWSWQEETAPFRKTIALLHSVLDPSFK